ncbi:MAG: energy transducer TonB [Ekhidna sp.]
MEIKKNEEYDLEQRRPLFFGIGMIISISLAITAFEWKSEVEPIMSFETITCDFPEFIPPITINTPPPPPPPKAIIIKPVEDTKIIKDSSIIDIAPPSDEPVDIYIPAPPSEVIDEVPRNYAEVMPAYERGMERFYQFMGKNIKYPKTAKRMGIEGKVFLQFIVGKDGSLTGLKVIKGIGAGCDEEALRVMRMIPSFIPGKQGDVRVPVKMVIPINFELK